MSVHRLLTQNKNLCGSKKGDGTHDWRLVTCKKCRDKQKETASTTRPVRAGRFAS